MSIVDLISDSLAQKYAIMKQQADATSKNADTAALTGQAQAGLDQTRAKLLPGESAASIGKLGAETTLLGEQAKYLGPQALSLIAQQAAETGFTNTQNAVLQVEGLSADGKLLPSNRYALPKTPVFRFSEPPAAKPLPAYSSLSDNVRDFSGAPKAVTTPDPLGPARLDARNAYGTRRVY
jgi:hypothetical protein